MSLLSVNNVSIGLRGTPLLHDINYSLDAGGSLALVGESGSGKSLSTLIIAGLLSPYTAWDITGSITYNNNIFDAANQQGRQSLRGVDIGLIFQDPMNALNPLHRVGQQIEEILRTHNPMSRSERQDYIRQLCDDVHLDYTLMNHYPHELSGGQRQRVMIAHAIAVKPAILIADEPTTALDAYIKNHILQLIKTLQQRYNMGLLYITHDIKTVPLMSDAIMVLKDGHIIERGDTDIILKTPEHDYTKTLIESLPKTRILPLTNKSDTPLLETHNINVHFPLKKGLLRRVYDYIYAVNDISMTLRQGQTLGIIGESGSGKTSFVQSLLGLVGFKGYFTIAGQRVDYKNFVNRAWLATQIHYVFQDPFTSLSPRMTIYDILVEALWHDSKKEKKQDSDIITKKIADALHDVGLPAEASMRYPHEFSGGQRQRIAIARAILAKPAIIIWDEPTSSLDVSVQKQILDLLSKLQEHYGFSYIIISHDIDVIRAMSDNIMVLYQGNVVDYDKAATILQQPTHDYTKLLLTS